MRIDYTPLAPPGWFSRLKIEPLNDKDYGTENMGVVGMYMIRAERSSDKACFYTTMSLRDSLAGVDKERVAEVIEYMLRNCFYTLEHVSDALDRKDAVPSADSIKASIGAFDSVLPLSIRSDCGKSKYAHLVYVIREVFSEFVDIYGAKTA